VASTILTFTSRDQHRSWLTSQAILPRGFRVGAAPLDVVPVETGKPARMVITLLALDRPTPDFAALFTRNAFPGAPVIVGRRRLSAPRLGAVVINNKISNVCAEGGVEASERLCAHAARGLGLSTDEVLPCSTGVIGWRLPVDAMAAALPAAIAALQPASILPAAEGIVTTDLYPKVRRRTVGEGSVVGIAKGAGMIEPSLATMLVYVLTDLAVPRDVLRETLAHAVDASFHVMTIDGDTSTSDTVVALSSGAIPCRSESAFADALTGVCADLAEDVVRNGEGVHHVIRVAVRGAPSVELARGIGKAIVGSPLFQCAVCGNDPNVGRLVAAIGKHVGLHAPGLDLSHATLTMGGRVIFVDGSFRLDREAEAALVAHLRAAELYASVPPPDGVAFRPPLDYPPHERAVAVTVDLHAGSGAATVLGADRSHEYISENADYRS